MKQLNILLSCSFGVSTSMLTKKMVKYFEEKNYPFTVNAEPETSALNLIDNYDVVLIGPQVKYLLKKFENAVNGRIPIYIMDTRAYGMQKVDEIIETMLEEMKDDGYYEE